MVMHNYANLRGLLLPEIEISYLIGSFIIGFADPMIECKERKHEKNRQTFFPRKAVPFRNGVLI